MIFYIVGALGILLLILSGFSLTTKTGSQRWALFFWCLGAVSVSIGLFHLTGSI